MLNLQESNISILFSPLLFWKIEVMTRTATKFLSLLLSCVALGSDTQGTHKEQNLLFVRHAREWKLESDVQKNRSIKPKIRWKAKKSPDVWQLCHQALEVQQALSHFVSRTDFSIESLKSPGKPSVFRGFSWLWCRFASTAADTAERRMRNEIS